MYLIFNEPGPWVLCTSSSLDQSNQPITFDLSKIIGFYRELKTASLERQRIIRLAFNMIPTALRITIATNHDFAVRRDAMIAKMIHDFYFIVCESIADWIDSDGGEICITELKQRSGYGCNLLPSTFQSRIAKDHADMLNNGFHRHLDVFTAEPVNQWIEITDSINMLSFNPVWFSGHRVYQFPVTFENHNHFCNVKINSGSDTIVKFSYSSRIENCQVKSLSLPD